MPLVVDEPTRCCWRGATSWKALTVSLGKPTQRTFDLSAYAKSIVRKTWLQLVDHGVDVYHRHQRPLSTVLLANYKVRPCHVDYSS